MDEKDYNLKMSSTDPETIDVSISWERNYWTSKLDCTVDELLIAEKEVGNKISKIKESIYLMRKGSKMK